MANYFLGVSKLCFITYFLYFARKHNGLAAFLIIFAA